MQFQKMFTFLHPTRSVLLQRVNVMWNHVKNQGKGFGFVTFSTPTEASLAIQHMHGTTYQGRELQVKFKSNAVSSS